jgi:long-subunit fatty acid transport protein
MKKIILSAVAVLTFGFTNAQEVKFGAKVALNIASLTGDVEDASSLIGFQIGGFAEFKLSKKFAFQPELMYSAQGGKETTSVDLFEFGASTDTETKLSYLNIPLMAKYYATPKLSFEFGPQIGFLLSAKNDITMTGTSIFEGSFSESRSVDIKDSTSSVDFGLNLGAGYDFTENISAGLRYNFGLSNTYDGYGDDSIKNGVFSVSVGYKF